MPAPIQQISSQEIFCELRLQKTQEVRRENMGNMISVHREECNYEGTEAELMGCQKPLRFCLLYFCISGKRIHCLVLAVEQFCICCWCRGCFRAYLKKHSANCDVHLAESLFQTRSEIGNTPNLTYLIRYSNIL